MDRLEVGEKHTLSKQYEGPDDAPKDPTTVTLTVVDPAGGSSTPALTHAAGTGAYSFDLDPASAGVYTWTWAAQGNGFDETETGYLAVGLSRREGPCEPWCDWELVTDVARGLDPSKVDPEVQEQVVDFASVLLWGLTNGRYPGLCEGTFSICAACRYTFSSWSGLYAGGALYAAGGCGCCGPWEKADLAGAGWPVWAALEVKVNGAVVPRSAWRIDSQRWLSRLDGDVWPRGADLTDPTAFQARLVYGWPVPQGGDRAAAALAGEIAKSYAGGDCVLPAEVTQIVREGVTYRVVDAKELFKDGLTGVASTDRWLAAEAASRQAPAGGFDPTWEPDRGLERLGTDRGADQL